MAQIAINPTEHRIYPIISPVILPENDSKWPNGDLKNDGNVTKVPQNGPKWSPKWLQIPINPPERHVYPIIFPLFVPKWPIDPKWCKMAQNDPKMTPKWPQMAPNSHKFSRASNLSHNIPCYSPPRSPILPPNPHFLPPNPPFYPKIIHFCPQITHFCPPTPHSTPKSPFFCPNPPIL